MKTISNSSNELVLLQEQLEELLSESSVAALERSPTAFDRLSHPFQDSIVLFGAGHLGRKTLSGMLQLGIKPLAFADNNSKLWDKEIQGIPVFSPELAAGKFGKSAVFLVAIWGAGSSHRLSHTRKQLEDLGCQKVISVTYLFWKYPDLFLPHGCLDLPNYVIEESNQIRQVFKLWADVDSAKEYLAQLRCRLYLDFDGLPNPYPPTFIKMDIEGAEIDALHGAAALIKKFTPVLAICIYHQQNHLWQIPSLIATISDGYQFFLRPHAEECYDCVCYAIPLNRLNNQSIFN